MLKIEDIAEKYQLTLMLMFGSRAIGKTHPGSDLDIAVYGTKVFSETEKVQLTYHLCNIFRTNHIDLVDLRTAPPRLKYEVYKNCKILFQRDPMLFYKLELANLHEIEELEVLDRIRRERLGEFAK